ncbi:MAG TPA: DUF1998 domain-containing protein [Candidatus Nitrosotalea sp.]|nr:DUF1998 domain-containing protein [Candidatus Nitrosotalea sp.]
MTQSIRLSQFILTYGPGAILEGSNGPRIIPDADIGLFYKGSQFRPDVYRINDPRMSKGLLDGANIFRLPSNAEVGYLDNQDVYRTKPFPLWKLCMNKKNHNDSYLLYKSSQCPVCRDPDKSGQEAIRFIMACPKGHMDEISWDYLIHKGVECPRTVQKLDKALSESECFYWLGAGGTLSQIEIQCPKCSMKTNFGNAYSTEWRCSGRNPHQEELGPAANRAPRTCDRRAKIIQRQASNLRIPELRTLLSVRSVYTSIHTHLSHPAIKGILDAMPPPFPSSLDHLGQILSNMVKGGSVSQNTMDEILRSPWKEVQDAIIDTRKVPPTSYRELILDEFGELIAASVRGAPPSHSPPPNSKVIFEAPSHLKKIFTTPNGKKFRVQPITRLRTVTVQIGFRREIESSGHIPAEPVNISIMHSNEKWYPGVEFLGEGLFIMMDNNEGWQEINGNASRIWLNSFSNPATYSEFVFKDQNHREELHPVFVWWHTLAHLLIRTIGEEAGYSSASIRERIYFEKTSTGTRGGILIYSTQPGSEGTMGGLIALAPYFDRMLDSAMNQLETCSGDPLCYEQKFRHGNYNGAACYGCTMNSETSCEHRNMWLDRKVLVENMP